LFLECAPTDIEFQQIILDLIDHFVDVDAGGFLDYFAIEITKTMLQLEKIIHQTATEV
jgi:malate synthase